MPIDSDDEHNDEDDDEGDNNRLGANDFGFGLDVLDAAPWNIQPPRHFLRGRGGLRIGRLGRHFFNDDVDDDDDN